MMDPLSPYFVDSGGKADNAGIRISDARRQRSLDQVVREPQEQPTRSVPSNIVRAYDAAVDDVNPTKRSIVARINTANVDRYNTVILPRGARTKNWRAAGGPVLWEHGNYVPRGTIPIANSKELWNNGGPIPTEIIAEPMFVRDEFADMLFDHYKEGRIRGWSVNILPSLKNASPPTPEELRSRPDWEGATLIYREWDLAEFSGTTIPGNADALTSDRAAVVMELVQRSGLWLTDEAKAAYEAALVRTSVEPSPGKPAPNSRDIRIDTDGQTWTLRDAAGRAVAMYADARLAEESLKMMTAAVPGAPSGLERLWAQLMIEQRAATDQLIEDMVKRIELKLFGRV